MFSVTSIMTPRGSVQYREEHLTGLRCRISQGRLLRKIDQELQVNSIPDSCPFCPDSVLDVTPVFPDGSRIQVGESVTFPNLYPFGENHVVTVITRDHFPETFNRQQVADALKGQAQALMPARTSYPSINMNFLPSAGASLLHPHMQGLAESRPSWILERYLAAGRDYRSSHRKKYWDAVREKERVSDRYLFGEEILWSAHAVPLGEREVRGILPVASIDEFSDYIDLLAKGIIRILSLYRRLGTHAFNMSLFFDRAGEDNGFCAFCSLISRINPTPVSTSDSAFMERLHLDPVIMTLPEELGTYYRKEEK